MFAYHIKPQEMRGSKLFPLNELRAVWPDLYAKYAEKYSWREKLMELTIPKADCFWNDVIHLTLVHPHEIFSLFKQAHEACNKTYERELEFFEIPLGRISHNDSFFYFIPPDELREDATEATPENQENFEPIREEHIFRCSEVHLQTATIIPDHFREYVHFSVARDRRTLLFATLPHLLVRGPIDVEGLRTLKWSEPKTKTCLTESTRSIGDFND